MTQGVLLFAHNSDKVNYGLIAAWQATRIQEHLQKPVSLVTDVDTLVSLKTCGVDVVNVFDQIFLKEIRTDQRRLLGSEWVLFKNIDRVDAYDITPYDETLLIDTDIFIMSDKLNLVWNHSEDILVSKYAQDALGRQFKEFEYLKEHGTEFFWATEFYFKKSETAKLFFDTCKFVKENYEWYSVLYGISAAPIRNDHVWSIALHELGGHAGVKWAQTIPRTLIFSLDRDSLLAADKTSVTLGGKVDEGRRVVKIEKQDLHFMNKYDLVKVAAQELGVTLDV